ncbi:DNA adenine methylase [Bacteroides pyogenes]|uniref:DNA adenine methylase n=1 Tax=Bacteroides pyogenes TaxID=310300 RepID=UPI002FD9C59D
MKYMGSKRSIAKDILPIMLDGMDIGDYFIDAFCGGCNVIDKVPNTINRIANDNNKYLIEMWKMLVTHHWLAPKYISRETYKTYRDIYNLLKRSGKDSPSDALIGWYGFMGSFNGRFFAGYSGHDVIIKGGKSRDYISESINNILTQKENLKGVDFRCGDYDTLTLPSPAQTVIYCDIPYKGTTQYSTSKNFDYNKFYNWCRKKHSDGYRIFISEYQMPNDFKCVWQRQVTNAINQNITKKPVEKLFTIG